jgi:hypothetical protein
VATFALTFNKVAVDLHFDQASAIDVRVEDGNVLFRRADARRADAWRLEDRTRGGRGITMTGVEADRFLIDTGLQAGDHLILGAIRDGWITSRRFVPIPGQDKPSRIWPSARIWSITGAPEQDGSMPVLSFQLHRAEDQNGRHVFTGTSSGDDARFKADLLKLHGWCSLHLSETRWELTATQNNTLSLDVVNGTVKSVPQGSQYKVSLWVEGKEHASFVSLSI